MTFNLKEQRVLPAVMMAVVAINNCADFQGVDMLAVSYLALGLSLLSFVVALYLIVRQNSITTFDFLTMLFTLTILAASLINGIGFKEGVYLTCNVMLMTLAFNYYQHNLNPLLIGLLIGFSIIIYWQFIQCVLHPDMWLIEDTKDLQGYILGGNYNQMGCRLICGLMTNILCLRISKWFWINLIPLVISCIAIEAMVQSMTALTCIIIFVIICMIPSSTIIKIASIGILIFVFLFQVFVCFNGKGFENNELAVWFLVDVLGKDITFTNRTELWDSAMRVIGDSPILGNGFVDSPWFLANMNSSAVGPHNFILNVLILGGIIALFFFTLIMLLVIKKIVNSHDRYTNIIFASIVLQFMMMLMEAYPIFFTIYLGTLAYYSSELSKLKTKTECRH